MLYSILIYGSEACVEAWAPEQEDEMLGRHAKLRQELTARGRLGPVLRLMPHTATTVRPEGDAPMVIDGPFAETKEQLMGIYIVDCETLDEAVAVTRGLRFETGVFEIRPLTWFEPGVLPAHIPAPPPPAEKNSAPLSARARADRPWEDACMSQGAFTCLKEIPCCSRTRMPSSTAAVAPSAVRWRVPLRARARACSWPAARARSSMR